jgi:hypothetical protein
MRFFIAPRAKTRALQVLIYTQVEIRLVNSTTIQFAG